MTERRRIPSLQARVSMAPAQVAPLTDDWKDDRRGSRHARGYGTAWDKLRPLILKRDQHLCQCRHCKAGNRIRPATQVDHITCKALWRILKGGDMQGVDLPSNLQAINEECHKVKTEEDRQATYAAWSKGSNG